MRLKTFGSHSRMIVELFTSRACSIEGAGRAIRRQQWPTVKPVNVTAVRQISLIVGCFVLVLAGSPFLSHAVIEFGAEHAITAVDSDGLALAADIGGDGDNDVLIYEDGTENEGDESLKWRRNAGDGPA